MTNEIFDRFSAMMKLWLGTVLGFNEDPVLMAGTYEVNEMKKWCEYHGDAKCRRLEVFCGITVVEKKNMVGMAMISRKEYEGCKSRRK